MQARAPHTPLRRSKSESPLRIASLAALAAILGAVIVVWVHRLEASRAEPPVLASTLGGRITMEEAHRLKAQSEALGAEIETLEGQLAGPGGSTTLTRPGALLVRARFATRTTLELVAKLVVAIERDRGYVANHLRREAQLEYSTARACVAQARQAFPIR